MKRYKPEEIEQFLIAMDSLFKYLKVQVPEVADLILMKSLRAEETDLEAIEQMVKNENVSSETLIKRYINELGSAIGDKRKLDLNFLGMIARCFGEDIAQKTSKKIKFNY